MKRRTFLTSAGVSGIGVASVFPTKSLGQQSSESETDETVSNGSTAQISMQNEVTAEALSDSIELVEVTSDSLVVSLDGFTINTVEWLSTSARNIGDVQVVESSNSEHTETIEIPADPLSEIALQASYDDMTVAFGRVVQNQDDEWVTLFDGSE